MISKLAYVHPDAKLGNNVTVEPFACIAGDVVLGDDCWVGPGAVIHCVSPASVIRHTVSVSRSFRSMR